MKRTVSRANTERRDHPDRVSFYRKSHDPLPLHETVARPPDCGRWAPADIRRHELRNACGLVDNADIQSATAEKLKELKATSLYLSGSVGDITCAGPARLAVWVERHNRKLMRYADFLSMYDEAGVSHLVTPTARTHWWVFQGIIKSDSR